VNRSQKLVTALILAVMIGAVACGKKKVSTSDIPAPPPPQMPTASLSADPTAIERGQSSQLSWQTDNATEIEIEGIGPVQASGSQAVTPETSTTYRLIAKGPGGQQEATARVTVSEPVASEQPPTEDEEALFARSVKPIYFDFDRYDLRSDQEQTLASNAAFFASRPQIQLLIEGHADERGSTEYNLALGESRANTVREHIIQDGVSASRISTVSYGKERPFCTESEESCWQENRRAHFVTRR
jgi:peptidoglycan-associated lipoprotein